MTTASPVRAATCPSAQANVVAPAPPLPPITPTVRPTPASSRSDSTSITQESDRGSSATFSAPTASAVRNISWATPPHDTMCTPGRRGGPTPASSSATSAPRSTTGAPAHPRSAAEPSGATSGTTPAAALSRSSSSRRVSSRVTISGAVMTSGSPPRPTSPRTDWLGCGQRLRHAALWTVAGPVIGPVIRPRGKAPPPMLSQCAKRPSSTSTRRSSPSRARWRSASPSRPAA